MSTILEVQNKISKLVEAAKRMGEEPMSYPRGTKLTEALAELNTAIQANTTAGQARYVPVNRDALHKAISDVALKARAHEKAAIYAKASALTQLQKAKQAVYELVFAPVETKEVKELRSILSQIEQDGISIVDQAQRAKIRELLQQEIDRKKNDKSLL